MRNQTKNLVLSGLFLAIGQILPFITGQIPQIGNMLCPMHFPIFLCAYFCGGWYAAVIGFICPLLRSVLFGMPAFFPNAVGMAFELMAYGAITGLIYRKMHRHNIGTIYLSLVCGMIGGRIVWGIVQVILMKISGGADFTISIFLTKGFLNAIPGIIAQLILIPLIVVGVNKAYRSRSS